MWLTQANTVQRKHIFPPRIHSNVSHSPVCPPSLCVFYCRILSAIHKFHSAADPISRSLALHAEDKGGCCLLLLVGIAVWRMPCGSLRWGWGIVGLWFKVFQMSWGLMMGKAGIGPVSIIGVRTHERCSGIILQCFSGNGLDFIEKKKRDILYKRWKDWGKEHWPGAGAETFSHYFRQTPASTEQIRLLMDKVLEQMNGFVRKCCLVESYEEF